MESNFKNIGKDLFQQSQRESSSAHGILDELYPYIYAASSRMSTRAISEWLCEQHNIKVSHSSIAKALRESGEYIAPIADRVCGLAELLERETEVPLYFVLYDVTGAPGVPESFTELESRLKELSSAAQRAVLELKSTWFEYPAIFREACYNFFPEPEADDAEEETK